MSLLSRGLGPRQRLPQGGPRAPPGEPEWCRALALQTVVACRLSSSPALSADVTLVAAPHVLRHFLLRLVNSRTLQRVSVEQLRVILSVQLEGVLKTAVRRGASS